LRRFSIRVERATDDPEGLLRELKALLCES
jgi:hypothetical protein